MCRGRRVSRLLIGLAAVTITFPAADAQALEWWNIFHYSQGVLSYRSHELDVPYDGSASATVDLVGGEIRLRDEHSDTRPWLLTGSFRLELQRQVVLGSTYSLLRGDVRVRLGANLVGAGALRAGPLLHLGAGKFNLLRIVGPTTAPNELILRESAGAGAYLAWRIKGYNPLIRTFGDLFELSAYGLARVDGGSATTLLPNPLQSSLGYEAGAIGDLWLGRFVLLELRWRSTYDQYEWAPASGGAEKSNFVNVENLIDFGLGVRI